MPATPVPSPAQSQHLPDPGTPRPDPAAPPARPPVDRPGTGHDGGPPEVPVREPQPAPPMKELSLPHERDQGPATGTDGPGPVDPVIAQAHADLEDGLVDTDLRATAGLDAQRRQALVRKSA